MLGGLFGWPGSGVGSVVAVPLADVFAGAVVVCYQSSVKGDDLEGEEVE